MFLENIKEAITSIFSNKMRSVLTMLGIIIGISAVITITTIGNSIQTTLTSTLNSLGGNTVQAYVDARYPEDDADWDTWEYPEMKTSDFVTQEMIDELEAEVCIVRQTVGSVSVQSGIRNFRQNTVDQMISQFNLFCGTLFHGLCCDFCCLAVPHNTRNIFRTGTTFTLLCSAVYERTDLNAFADVKETDSLRTVQFVSAGT